MSERATHELDSIKRSNLQSPDHGMSARRHGQGQLPPGNWTGWFRKSSDLLFQYFSLHLITFWKISYKKKSDQMYYV